MDDYSIKETYNTVKFVDAMETIRDYAFANSTSPCADDPLILHFRIMSKNQHIYNEMAKDLSNTLGSYLLDKQYSYENHGHNIGRIPLKTLKSKVLIIVDKSNAVFAETELDEYVNLASNSAFMRCSRFHDVKYCPDIKELIEYNKPNMTICIPDLSDKAVNYSAPIAQELGCQMIALSYQKSDNNLKYYNSLFDSAGSAFILKPDRLREKIICTKDPEPIPKEYLYDQQDFKVAGDLDFNI